MAERMIDVARALLIGYRGGLGMVTVAACALFAALSGSGPATTAAVGTVTIPAMRRDGYPSRFASAVVASGGALGSVIPPSNLLIIYGLVSDTSIPRLFLAGVLPGLMISFFLLVVSYFSARRNKWGGSTNKLQWGVFFKFVWAGKWSLGAPIIILGGIYGGIFTPTEAAGVAVFYSLFVGFFIYKGLTLKKIIDSLRFTALFSGLLIIIPPTIAFGQLGAFFDLPALVSHAITDITKNPVIIMMIIGIFYIFLGTFMDSLAQIVLFTGVFLPLVVGAGVDPVMFGVFTVITCEIGFLTPPVGANLNIAARLAGISIEDVSIGALPFILAYLLGLIVLMYFPQVSLLLPNWAYGAS